MKAVCARIPKADSRLLRIAMPTKATMPMAMPICIRKAIKTKRMITPIIPICHSLNYFTSSFSSSPDGQGTSSSSPTQPPATATPPCSSSPSPSDCSRSVLRCPSPFFPDTPLSTDTTSPIRRSGDGSWRRPRDTLWRSRWPRRFSLFSISP